MIPPIANQFVAGESTGEALDHIEKLNRQGVGGILNLLGEHYCDRPAADQDANMYHHTIDRIVERDLDACISVKPSQIGIEIGDHAFLENIEQIVAHAADAGIFVWIDMESHETTDATLNAYERLAREHNGGVGVCVQANLKRTNEDLARLASVPGRVRLVKGAYDEPTDLAYRKKEHVDERYREYLEYMFREFDGGIAVGSHDPSMIDYAKRLYNEYGTEFEIQMLMGVRDDAQFELARKGYHVNQYIPYGEKWFSYFYRRIRERKENLLFAARAVIS